MGSRPTLLRSAREGTRDGQIRRFTGNDYQNDLLAGNPAACIGWSGDVAQLAMDQLPLVVAMRTCNGGPSPCCWPIASSA